ncbi:MAG TPA: hypothetical protein VE076_12575 [Nitrososphaeraceae archaeon]|nr:hypothetical protein [Nitrososphaeraceae archaeon]
MISVIKSWFKEHTKELENVEDIVYGTIIENETKETLFQVGVRGHILILYGLLEIFTPVPLY